MDTVNWYLIPSRGKRFFSSPQHPDQLWVPSSSCPVVIRGSSRSSKVAAAWNWLLISI